MSPEQLYFYVLTNLESDTCNILKKQVGTRAGLSPSHIPLFLIELFISFRSGGH